MRRWTAQTLASTWAGIRAAIGLDEIGLVLALSLATIGLWSWLHQAALIVPAAVLLWIFLPARHPFVSRSAPDERASRKKV